MELGHGVDAAVGLDLVKGAVQGDHFAVQGLKGAQAEVAMPG